MRAGAFGLLVSGLLVTGCEDPLALCPVRGEQETADVESGGLATMADLETALARIGAADEAGAERRRAWLAVTARSDVATIRAAAEVAADATCPTAARRGALQVLTALADESSGSADTVARVLDDGDAALAQSAGAALGRMGDPGLAALIAATGPGRSHSAHVAAARALRWRRESARTAESALVRMLTECGPGAGMALAPRDRPERWTVTSQAADAAELDAADDGLHECRVAAVEALADIGIADARSVEALLRMLDSGDPRLTGASAAALARCNRTGALALVERLRDPARRDSRIAVVSALANSPGDEPAVHAALLEAASDPETCRHALRGLARVRTPESAAVLIAHLRDPLGTHRSFAIDALAEFGTLADAAIPALRELAESDQPHAAGRAARALDRLEAMTLEDALRLLESPHPHVRTAAARRAMRGAPADEILSRLDDPSDPRCLAAVDEIASRPAEFRQAMPALARLARASGDALGWAAAGALGKMGPEAGPVLAAIAEAPDRARLPTILDAVVATRWPGAGRVLVRALRERRDFHGGHFVESGLAPQGAGPELTEVLRAPDDDGRHRHLAAAVGLMRIEEPLSEDTEKRVISALTADWAFVRSRRVEVLGLLARFGPKAREALPRLRYAARVVEEEPVRAALRAAIRAIEGTAPPEAGVTER